MNAHQRFLATMRFEPVDRRVLWEWGPWASALRRWQSEGLGEGNYPPQFGRCDAKLQCGVATWMLPRYQTETLSEDDQYIAHHR